MNFDYTKKYLNDDLLVQKGVEHLITVFVTIVDLNASKYIKIQIGVIPAITLILKILIDLSWK